MANENEGLKLTEWVGINQTPDTVTLRDYYATEILKTLLEAQGRYRRMTLLSRIKWWLGGKGCFKDWKGDFDYNFQGCIKNSFECADMMLKERNANKN